jgi:N-acetylglucosaminyldiphosphoundecaprenol N-acetyl-beta-D-mannosaminyltransferase
MLNALKAIDGWIDRREQHYICMAPAHAVMEYRRDHRLLRTVNESGLTTPDGMSIVWLLRLMGYRHVERVYGPDLMLGACQLSIERGWKHFLYGGAPGVAKRLKAQLEARFPGLSIVGSHTPLFRPLTPDEDEAVVVAINDAAPDIVWVGLSTPKQERWMAQHVGRIRAPVLVGVGAAFDFLSGTKPQAPRWMQRSGLEWLFRLANEPKRLWRRYAEYPLFVILALAQLTGLMKFDTD